MVALETFSEVLYGMPEEMTKKTNMVYPHYKLLGFMILYLVQKENEM